MRLVDVCIVSSSFTMWNTQNINRDSTAYTFSPMYVFPVPGGPWMTANSLVSAICMALYWESSSSRSSADGQKARFVIGTSVPLKKERSVFSHAPRPSGSFWQLFYILVLMHVYRSIQDIQAFHSKEETVNSTLPRSLFLEFKTVFTEILVSSSLKQHSK